MQRALFVASTLAALTILFSRVCVASEILPSPSAEEAQRILNHAKTVDGYEANLPEREGWSFVNIRNVRKVDQKTGKVTIISDVLAACWINDQDIAQCVGFRHKLTPRKPR